MKPTLHKYQREAVDFILDVRQVYVMIDVGLGKTAIALDVINVTRCPAIVFAPLRVATIAWPLEIEKWTPHLSYAVLHGNNRERYLWDKKDIFLVSYSSIKWFHKMVATDRFRIRDYTLILDEASMVKNQSTQRFKLLSQLLPMFNDIRINLSATPNPNGYHELWSQYYMLNEGASLNTTFYSFRSSYFNYSGPPLYKMELREGAEKKIMNRIKDNTFRLDGNAYLELPDVVYNRIPTKMGPKIYKKYKEFERDFLIDLNNRQIAAFNASELSMKLRQYVQGAVYQEKGEGERGFDFIHKSKLEALKELMEANDHKPMLCAIQFKFEYKMICDYLKQNVPIVAGITSAAKSKKYIYKWNTGQIPLLLCHPASLGHGMNLQTGGNIIVWYGLPWSLEQYLQLNGRLARQGQLKTVVVNHIIMEGTIDETIFRALTKKNAVQQDLLNAMLRRYKDIYQC